jgi:hypothetical protein
MSFRLRPLLPRLTAGGTAAGAIVAVMFFGAHVDAPVQASRGAGGAAVASPDHHPSPAPTRRHKLSPRPSHAPRPTLTPTPSGTPTPTPVAGAIKPALVGLLDRGHQPSSQFDSIMGGWVVNVHWADVQPTSGTELNTSTIDQAVAAVRAINSQYHGNMGLKLRFFAGQWAPAWVKSLDGAPFTMTDPANGTTGTVGRWWTAKFAAAYNNVESLLAARYDNTPELREVTVSRCTTIYAEPMIRQGGSSASVAALLGAGYTVAADQQCQEEAVAAGAVWQHTRSDLSFNPYQSVSSTGVKIDEAFTEWMMGYCQTTLGRRCGIENNSLSDTRTSGSYPAMYAAMKAHAPSITVQTATIGRMISLQATLQDAVALGCRSVELPSGYQTSSIAMFQTIVPGLAASPFN